MADEGETKTKPNPPFPTMDLYIARSALDQKHKNTAVARVTTLKVVDENKQVLAGERYAILQGQKKDEGTLAGDGLATFFTVDPTQPFLFEVPGRACLILEGAYLVDTDKDEVEYGGTFVDWKLAENDADADDKFWKHYKRVLAADEKLRDPKAKSRPQVMTLWQHDHITRREIAIRPSYAVDKAQIQAIPIRIRVGPLLRHTDHQSASFWFETETPALVRVLCGKSKGSDPRTGGGSDVEGLPGLRKGWASTARVGGRYYALVEVTGLEEGVLYDYTVQLTAPPSQGSIPQGTALEMFFRQKPTEPIKNAIEAQLKEASYSKNPQITFRTLKRNYDSELRFAYGSCRKHPCDKEDEGGAQMKDHLEILAEKIGTSGEYAGWPSFVFHGGDQIYGDDIGVQTRDLVQRHRFGARAPGPAKAEGKQGNLLRGAFAGRFAHRFQDRAKVLSAHAKLKARATMAKGVLTSVGKDVLELYKKNAGKHFAAWENRDKADLFHTLGRAKNAKHAIKRKYIQDFTKESEKFEMEQKLAVCNDLLWNIPFQEKGLPKVDATAAYDDGDVPHAPAGDTEAVHAADFAEYAYLHEWAWGIRTTDIPRLMASVPHFTIFDDHEMTDDWNANSKWQKYLQNDKDELEHWPNTMSDALVAYLVYQHWGNVGNRPDEKTAILKKAAQTGKDALPELRALMRPNTTKSPGSLKWHYELPLETPLFLVADMRTKKTLPAAKEDEPTPEHETHQLDPAQLSWLEGALKKTKGQAAFIALSTPFLMPRFTSFTMKHLAGLTYVQSEASGNSTTEKLFGAMLGASQYLNTFNFYEDLGSWDKTKGHLKELATGGSALDDVGRRRRDFEHMNMDATWDDLRSMLERLKGSALKTIVLVSGDVHHNFALLGKAAQQPVGELPVLQQRWPQLLQIVSSGFENKVDGSGENMLAAGIVFFPRNHFFRGINVTMGGFPEIEKRNKSKLLGQSGLWTGETVGMVSAKFNQDGKYVAIKHDYGSSIGPVHFDYWTNDKEDHLSPCWVNPKLAWIGDLVRGVEIALWAKDILGSAEKRTKLAKALLKELGEKVHAEKHLREILDTVMHPAIQSLANGALSKVLAQSGRAKEALEAAEEGLKFLQEPGGKDRGGEAEVHSAYVVSLEQNGHIEEANAFKAEHPTTTVPQPDDLPAPPPAPAAERPRPAAVKPEVSAVPPGAPTAQSTDQPTDTGAAAGGAAAPGAGAAAAPGAGAAPGAAAGAAAGAALAAAAGGAPAAGAAPGSAAGGAPAAGAGGAPAAGAGGAPAAAAGGAPAAGAAPGSAAGGAPAAAAGRAPAAAADGAPAAAAGGAPAAGAAAAPAAGAAAAAAPADAGGSTGAAVAGGSTGAAVAGGAPGAAAPAAAAPGSAAGTAVAAGGGAASVAPGVAQVASARKAVDNIDNKVADAESQVDEAGRVAQNPESKLNEKTGAQQREVRAAVNDAQNAAADPTGTAMRDTEAGRAASQTKDSAARQVSQVENTTPDQVADQAVGSQRSQAQSTVDRAKREGDVESRGRQAVSDAEAPVDRVRADAESKKSAVESKVSSAASRPQDEVDSARDRVSTRKREVEDRVHRETDVDAQKNRAANAVKPDSVREVEGEVELDKGTAGRVRARAEGVKDRADSVKDAADKQTK